MFFQAIGGFGVMEASPAAAGKHASSTMDRHGVIKLNRRRILIGVLGKSIPFFDLDNTPAGILLRLGRMINVIICVERHSAFE
jgi:hypothetical protein